MGKVAWRRVGMFYGLSLLGALLSGLGFWLTSPLPVVPVLVLVGMMWTPALAALIVQRVNGEPVAGPLGLRLGRLRWVAAAVAAPLLVYALILAVGWALPGVGFDPTLQAFLARLEGQLPSEAVEQARQQLAGLPVHPLALAFLAMIPAGLPVNGLAALGEELGWRGWLYEALRPLGFWRSSLLTGALWGLWHAPIILQGHNFPDHRQAGVLVMIVGCVAMSPLLAFFRARSQTVISAAVFHGAFNAGGGITALVLIGSDLLVSPLGLVGIVAMGSSTSRSSRCGGGGLRGSRRRCKGTSRPSVGRPGGGDPMRTSLLALALAACAPTVATAPEPAAAEAVRAEATGAGDLAFAASLYRALADDDANLFFSPVSVRMALTMTFAGADGATRDAMAKALRLPPEPDAVHAAYGAWLADLAAAEERPYDLAIANRLWIQDGISLEPAFLDLTERHYAAGAAKLDLRGDPVGSRAAINGWVGAQTRDRIPELLPDGFLTPLSTLVLTNAVYFHGKWAWAFPAEATHDAPFTLLDGSAVDVPLMHLERQLQYAELDGVQVLKLPYQGDRLSMVVLLPSEGGLADLEGRLDAALFTSAREALRWERVRTWLPRFEHDTTYGLEAPLDDLGMGVAFTNAADFSRMSQDVELRIDKVIHKAFIKVDEEGTEAAAATAVGMVMKTSIQPPPSEPVVFRADRPFVFGLWDDVADQLLFIGRVTDPR